MLKLRMLLFALVNAAILWSGTPLLPNATGQTQNGVIWINDSFKGRGGQGIYQLNLQGRLELLIPNDKLKQLDATRRNWPEGVSDLRLGSQGEVLLIHGQSKQILKATLLGELAVETLLLLHCPGSTTIDTQGNYLIVDFCSDAIFQVEPDGLTRLVARLPSCPDEAGNISAALDFSGDYIVATYASCIGGKIFRIKPSGEMSTIVEGNPLLEGLHDIVSDFSRNGFFVLNRNEKTDGLIHISSAGEITPINVNYQFPKKGDDVVYWSSLNLGPNGDLLLGTFCGDYPSPRCPPSGVYQISPDGSKVKVLYEGDALALPISLLWIPQ